AWASWVRTHYTSYKRQDEEDWAERRAAHAYLLQTLADERQAPGGETFLEGRKDFSLRKEDGDRKGRADLVTIAPDGTCTVWDAKTGQRRDKDRAQVLLYMLLLPASHPRYRGRRMAGCIAYETGERVFIAPEEVTPEFKGRVRYYV